MDDGTVTPDREPLIDISHVYALLHLVMAENARFLRALRRIADTARRIDPTPRPTPTIQATPSILTSLPEHKPLLPLLLSHDIPPKLAGACADRYDGYASQLRAEAESKLTPYLVNGSESQPATIYSIFLKEYRRTLQRWSQSILNTALKGFKRDSVELRNLEVTYPVPLWLPLPPDPTFTRESLEKKRPLLPMTRPAHAFPTTYPPPLRPPSGIPPVEWFRIPEASPTPTPTSAIDLDSLCNQFTVSLIIDENPQRSSQPKLSIFSLSVVTREEHSGGHSQPKPPIRKPFRADAPPKQSTTCLRTPPLRVTKPRQLSVPPSYPPSFTRAKSTPRKASAPARVSTLRHTAPSQPSGATHCITSTTSVSPLNTPTAGGLDTYSYPGPSTPPLYSISSLNSISGRTTHTPQSLPYSLASPTTPPTLLPDLFSEPIVAPSTPIHLSPRSSLIPIIDPFLQFQPQSDYFSDHSLVSPFDYSGSTPGLATNGFVLKSALDAPLWPDHSYGIPAPITSNSLENDFLSTYTVS